MITYLVEVREREQMAKQMQQCDWLIEDRDRITVFRFAISGASLYVIAVSCLFFFSNYLAILKYIEKSHV